MTPPDIAMWLCIGAGALIGVKELFRQRAVRRRRRRMTRAALWDQANEARRKARQEWEGARARRDTRDEGRAAAEAKAATTRALRLEVAK